MDVARRSLEERRDPDRSAPVGEPALGAARLRLVGDPAHERAAAVEALPGVARPDGALAPVEPGCGGAEGGLVGGGHDLARRTIDAGAVEQHVVRGLVLEGHPLGAPAAHHRPAPDRRDRLEWGDEDQGVALRVEPVERLRHGCGGIGRQALELTELVDGVGRAEVQVDPLGVVGVGQAARPEGCPHDQDTPGAQAAQLLDPSGGRGDGNAGQHDRSATDPVAQGLADAFGDGIRHLSVLGGAAPHTHRRRAS